MIVCGYQEVRLDLNPTLLFGRILDLVILVVEKQLIYRKGGYGHKVDDLELSRGGSPLTFPRHESLGLPVTGGCCFAAHLAYHLILYLNLPVEIQV